MTAGSSIDYDALTQDALRGMVRNLLVQVAKKGLPGDHHFYIAFNTQAAGVVLSRRLREKYPEEMMIVLQHRFWDLAVTDESFEVKLSFDGIPERLSVPFEALKVFFDPSVRFTLQFGDAAHDDHDGPGRRQGDSRRNRTRQRPRPDSTTEAIPPQSPPAAPAQPAIPAALAPRPAEPPRPVPVPSAGPAADAPAKPGGAKVFSLDQFRKK